jgi:hypothetical protein
MGKRTWIIGLLGICLIALVGKDASANVCIFKVGSTCIMWSGSVECQIDMSGVHPGTTAVCSASGESTWLVACVNHGGNFPPGINLVSWEATLQGEYTLEEGDVERNGRANVTAFANPEPQFLIDLVEAGACPNPNYSAVAAVPCSMEVTIQEYDENNCLDSDATYFCELPDCETLGYDEVTMEFERRQYDCMRLDTNNYKCR